MRFDEVSRTTLDQVCAVLEQRARRCGPEPVIRYLDLGTRMVRLICHSPAFMRHVERQMTCALREEAPAYDVTLVIWQERSVPDAAFALLSALDNPRYRRERLARLTGKKPPRPEAHQIFDESLVRFWPLLNVQPGDHSISAFNPATSTYYYAVENLEPEEFIKRGHILVQTLFRICNVPGSSLAHGAVVGLNDTGVLFCAFGYRGKSTLSVHALLHGFDYVSDDYLILGRREGEPLRAWPIYSIIALAPQAYQAMYESFRGKFLSNNARKDKYLFNISAYHDQFRHGYPVRLCMFPNICGCAEPSIEPGYKELALEELAFSTLNNTGNKRDALTIGKLHSFVHDLPFYRFNLSSNISRNTRLLREFLENWQGAGNTNQA